MERTETTFTLEDNNLELVPILVRHLAGMCEEFAVCRNGEWLQTAVALEEAMVNGIIHGNLEVSSTLRDRGEDGLFQQLVAARRRQAPYALRKLSVHGIFRTGEARFAIRDEGPGFDPRSVPDPTLVENLEKPHGRGLFLIRAFMDQVSFNKRGNVIHLIKTAPVETCRQPDALSP